MRSAEDAAIGRVPATRLGVALPGDDGVLRPTVQAQNKPAPVLLFVVNVAWFFCLHRLHLARAAQAAGYEVHVATAPDTEADVAQIIAAGLHYHRIGLTRGTANAVGELRLTYSLYRLYRRIRPTIVHHVTIKPILCGTLAARLARVPAIVNAIPGLGFVFVASGPWASLRRRAVTTAYRRLFARRSLRVIFENADDLALFERRRITRAGQGELIRGAGVDLDKFRPRPKSDGPLLIVLAARMIWIKGVAEFCEAARLVLAAGLDARFVLVGRADVESRAGVPESWLRAQQQASGVEWLGHKDDMASVYAAAHVICLPSYGEGVPTVLLEAAACGCAIIATDVPGCREVVLHNTTGLLVPPRDPQALAAALSELIADRSLRDRLAAAALAKVHAEFSVQLVQRSTLELYSELLNEEPAQSSANC
jgi:glycosyltransferase involved in cell wall biosynthesis